MEIAEVTGKRHSDIMRDVRDEIEKLGNGGIDTERKFALSERQDSTGRKIPYYILTKEGVLQLAARYDAVVRAKLIELAMKQDKPPVHIDSKFLFNIAAQLEAKEQENQALTAKVEQDKPKVLFADAVSTARTTILIGELAKLLKQNGIEIGEKRLFQWLRENNYLISRKGTDYNAPTQKSMQLQLFTVKETTINHSDGHITINKTTKVTGKGQQYFINKFLNKTA
jgi:phage antirepressor YoqD-like protein